MFVDVRMFIVYAKTTGWILRKLCSNVGYIYTNDRAHHTNNLSWAVIKPAV